MNKIKYIYKVGGDTHTLSFSEHKMALETIMKGGQFLIFNEGSSIINIRNINSVKVCRDSVEFLARSMMPSSYTPDQLREGIVSVKKELAEKLGVQKNKEITSEPKSKVIN